MQRIVNLEAFTDTRLQLHALAQLAGAVGTTFAPPDPLFHHTALHWDPAHRALLSEPASDTDIRAGLRVADATLLVLEGRRIVAQLEMEGHTLADGAAWLTAELDNHALGQPLALRPRQKRPTHSVSDGAPFAPDAQAAHELADLFAEAHDVFTEWAARFDDAGPILVWPHHFDMAFLRTIHGHPGGDDARTIGFGMTPGYHPRREPYGYVTLWPYPENPDLPSLPVGSWNTEGWIGAVLTASEHDGTREQLLEWLEAANAACEGFIGGDHPAP